MAETVTQTKQKQKRKEIELNEERSVELKDSVTELNKSINERKCLNRDKIITQNEAKQYKCVYRKNLRSKKIIYIHKFQFRFVHVCMWQAHPQNAKLEIIKKKG